MTRENLGYYLGDLLQEEYLEALWDRWEKVVQAIDRMAEKNKGMIVKKEDWGQETAKLFAGEEYTYINIGEMQIADVMQ